MDIWKGYKTLFADRVTYSTHTTLLGTSKHLIVLKLQYTVLSIGMQYKCMLTKPSKSLNVAKEKKVDAK